MSTMTGALRRAANTPGPACAGQPERMFPVVESERPGDRTSGEVRALQVCAACPVLAECRRAVLESGGAAPLAYGVAGGMTREDRRAARAASRGLRRDAAPLPLPRSMGEATVAHVEAAGDAA